MPELGIASDERQSLETQADYDALFADYERKSLPRQTEALKKIGAWVQAGERVALTCFEKLPEQCHRHCVAEALEADVWPAVCPPAFVMEGKSMPRERLLITVKTYPTLSRKHGELVCTAGVRADGSWIRLYPIPFRLMDYGSAMPNLIGLKPRSSKAAVIPAPKPFTRWITDIVKTGELGLEDKWRERRRLILERCQIQTRLADIIAGAHENRFSLTVFKPAKILDFIWETDDRDWDPEKIQQMRNHADQGELFAAGEDWRQTFKLIPKLPYKFSYRFADAAGKESELQVLDWEAGALYWNCLKN